MLAPTTKQVSGRAVVGFALLSASLIPIGFAFTQLSVFGALRSWDLSLVEHFERHRTAAVHDFAGTISSLGDTPFVVGVALLITAVLALARRWRVMLLLPLALAIEVVTFTTVNYVVRRPRPPVVKLGSEPSTFSFPSGHVAATLVCWLSLAVVLMAFGHRRIARLLVAIGALHALTLAWARVYLAMHYPVDVLVGLAIGLAAVTLAARALDIDVAPRRHGERYSVSHPSRDRSDQDEVVNASPAGPTYATKP